MGHSSEEQRGGRYRRDAPAYASYVQKRERFWDAIAGRHSRTSRFSRAYQKRLRDIYRFHVGPGQRVLELGCGTGDLLADLQPSYGLGVDLSGEMILRASSRHPDLAFVHCRAEELSLDEAFDVIILSDLVNDLWDIQAVFEVCRKLSHERTRMIINSFSRLWQVPLWAARRAGLATPVLEQNWVTREDVANLLSLEGFEVLRSWSEILLPLQVPAAGAFMNRYLVKIWPFKEAALTNFTVARPRPERTASESAPKVSVVVPARNEAGNIPEIIRRVPEMGGGTEIVFVEGHSTDDTWETLVEAVAKCPEGRCRLFRQKGQGKGDAVRLGFAEARHEILMILDADLTVAPEDLPRFYEALVAGQGDFINGVRLVYPMEKKAMRFANIMGNKFFSLFFTALLGQNIKDTLCGTKVLWGRDYRLIERGRDYFGDFDPFGDFDLIFGAAKLNLKIVDMPVRYRERTYGSTNIQRWRHGLMLLQMVVFAAKRMKFV